MKKKKIKRDIRNLIFIDLQLNKYGGPEKNGYLFEESIFLSEKILKDFGLPNSNKYGKMLNFKSLPTDHDIELLIKKLKKTAAEYLQTSPKNEVQLLHEAIELNLDVDDVFPELDIPTHIYTLFVYNEILLKKVDSPKSVLDALRKANKSKYLNFLGGLVFTKKYGNAEKEMFEYLNNNGIKYLDTYLPNLKFD